MYICIYIYHLLYRPILTVLLLVVLMLVITVVAKRVRVHPAVTSLQIKGCHEIS